MKTHACTHLSCVYAHRECVCLAKLNSIVFFFFFFP